MRFRIAEKDGKAYVFDGETTYYGPYYPSAVVTVWLDLYRRGKASGHPCTKHRHDALRLWSPREYMKRVDMGLDLSVLLQENPLPPVAVKWVRVQRRESRARFASHCGVTSQAVYLWETGECACGGAAAILIRDFLDPSKSE